MSDERLDELERLADAATPGPWEWGIEDYSMATLESADPGTPDHDQHIVSVSPCRACRGCDRGDPKPKWEWGRCMTPREPDAAFIAAARTALPQLIQRVRELEKELADARR